MSPAKRTARRAAAPVARVPKCGLCMDGFHESCRPIVELDMGVWDCFVCRCSCHPDPDRQPARRADAGR